MKSEPSFRLSVCTEYDSLLHTCKRLFDQCVKDSQEPPVIVNESRKKEGPEQLREQYEKSYARLVYHLIIAECASCLTNGGAASRVALPDDGVKRAA